jgi:anti-sigma factor RsiW
MTGRHISDDDLERYCLGMLRDEGELALLEEHLLACGACADRAEEAQDRVDTIRGAIVEAGLDLD